MSCRQMLNLVLAVLITNAFGATSVLSHQPGTTSAFGATNISSHRPEMTSTFGATNFSSHRLETTTKSANRSEEGAVTTAGIVDQLKSTNGSFYQNGSATASLKGLTNYAADQETPM